MWKKGETGNPRGIGAEKQYTAALRAAVNTEDPKTRRRKLLMIAEKAADLAVKGEAWAIQHVADRLDGKPAQEQTVTVRSELDSMNDAELRDFIKRELASANQVQPIAPKLIEAIPVKH